MPADCACMDMVIDLREFSPGVPAQFLCLILLQALELLDHIKFKFDRNPASELECDVLMGKGATITPGTSDYTFRISRVYPFLRRKGKGIQSCLFFKPIEFDRFKIRIEQCFPDSEVFNRIRLRIQLQITIKDSLLLCLAMSVNEM